jgi:hypothetical protein
MELHETEMLNKNRDFLSEVWCILIVYHAHQGRQPMLQFVSLWVFLFSSSLQHCIYQISHFPFSWCFLATQDSFLGNNQASSDSMVGVATIPGRRIRV